MKTLDPSNFNVERLIAVDEFLTFTIPGNNMNKEIRPEDATTFDMMNAAELSGVLDFWNNPDEDRYTDQDGDAV